MGRGSNLTRSSLERKGLRMEIPTIRLADVKVSYLEEDGTLTFQPVRENQTDWTVSGKEVSQLYEFLGQHIRQPAGTFPRGQSTG
jgi:hypothetical protein